MAASHFSPPLMVCSTLSSVMSTSVSPPPITQSDTAVAESLISLRYLERVVSFLSRFKSTPEQDMALTVSMRGRGRISISCHNMGYIANCNSACHSRNRNAGDAVTLAPCDMPRTQGRPPA